jgi:hypothetical protein
MGVTALARESRCGSGSQIRTGGVGCMNGMSTSTGRNDIDFNLPDATMRSARRTIEADE